MLTQEEAVEIRVMARRGESIRAIAKQFGCSRNTVRRYLREPAAQRYGPRAPRACKLDGFEPYLLERIAHARPRWIPATVLLREIRQRGYTGVGAGSELTEDASSDHGPQRHAVPERAGP
jgi:transposase